MFLGILPEVPAWWGMGRYRWLNAYHIIPVLETPLEIPVLTKVTPLPDEFVGGRG